MCISKRLSLADMVRAHLTHIHWENTGKLLYFENVIPGTKSHCVTPRLHITIGAKAFAQEIGINLCFTQDEDHMKQTGICWLPLYQL